MSGSAWAISMAVLYLVLVFTIALLTFRKGHWVLGLIGFIFPVLWLIRSHLAGPPAPLKARRVAGSWLDRTVCPLGGAR